LSEAMGVVNGTTNYILTAMEKSGAAFADALATAQQLGYAEQSAALESMELACLAAGISRDRWFFVSEREAQLKVDPDKLLARRAAGEPLAYILGEWDFYGLTLKTDRRALIPRDDSCCVLELFLSRLQPGKGEILDLCTGTGCLGLAAASVRKDVDVILCDFSDDALSLARENIGLLAMENRVKALKGNALKAPEFENERFLGMICNPPYLRVDELTPTAEPLMALDGGEDGLIFYRSVSSLWKNVIVPGGVLCFEVGYTQSAEVAEIMAAEGFEDIVTEKDLSGISRAVLGKRPL
ncbi:MAG: peptide chain release factor N(5)-glutamine methyltransferase, partial [Clostridia bacterium]|nr:peptide chain release factor N(5)-glutamine methyltransferase [Clostridia bacterium]